MVLSEHALRCHRYSRDFFSSMTIQPTAEPLELSSHASKWIAFADGATTLPSSSPTISSDFEDIHCTPALTSTHNANFRALDYAHPALAARASVATVLDRLIPCSSSTRQQRLNEHSDDSQYSPRRCQLELTHVSSILESRGIDRVSRKESSACGQEYLPAMTSARKLAI